MEAREKYFSAPDAMNLLLGVSGSLKREQGDKQTPERQWTEHALACLVARWRISSMDMQVGANPPMLWMADVALAYHVQVFKV